MPRVGAVKEPSLADSYRTSVSKGHTMTWIKIACLAKAQRTAPHPGFQICIRSAVMV